MKYAGGALISSLVLDRSVNRPITAQLHNSLRTMILRGDLRAGERLPASRTLAKDLGVSRTTVVSVMDRLLSEGLLEARLGAGTWVSRVLSDEQPVPLSKPVALGGEPRSIKMGAAPRSIKISQAMEQVLPDLVARKRLPRRPHCFITGLPALDEFPMAQWAKLSAKHLRTDRSNLMGYGHPFGLMALRKAIAAHVDSSRGIHCDPGQIFVTGGAQHAFQLIGNMLLNKGDKVWIEDPGAIGARNSFIANGAEIVPVRVDTHGMVVADGVAKAPVFKLAFVTPSHQQPLSVIMTLARRLALLRAASGADALIVEDDYDSEFHYVGHPVSTLKSVDTTDRVVYVGTFSKSLFPALRLGFIISPLRLIDAFEQVFNAFQPGLPTHTQAVVADFMEAGFFATHIRRMRQIYADRYQSLMTESSAGLSDFLDIQPTNSGLHTVGYFRRPGRDRDIDERTVSRALMAQGISARPLGQYAMMPLEKKGLTLGFGAIAPRSLRQGVAKMSQILASELG